MIIEYLWVIRYLQLAWTVILFLMHVWSMSFMCVLVVLVLESPEWKRSGSHGRDQWSTISEEVWTEVRHRPLIRVAGCLLINLAHWAFKPLSQQLLKVYSTHLGQYVTPACSALCCRRVFTAITKSHPQRNDVVKSDLDKCLPNIQDIQCAFAKVRQICVVGEFVCKPLSQRLLPCV